MLEGTPWFKTLEGSARWLCFKLVKLMSTPSYAGAIPFSDTRRVSLLVSMDGTEVQTHLETLVETGLLARDDRGYLSCPMLGDVAARTVAARQNGTRGGRPRKGETPEQYAARRRQGEMLLPIGGMAEKPSETQQWETSSAGAAPRTTSSSSLRSETTQPVAHEGEWQKLASLAIAAAALPGKRIAWTPAQQWEAWGATPELVERVVGDVMRRGTKAPSEISSIQYFSNAIKRAVDEAGGTSAPSAASIVRHQLTGLEARMRTWEESGHHGPPPRLHDQHHAA
ncbi:MAG: putative phage protein [Rubritepida sp.]|nr:putative phage protein [Rubritepida sp.]